MSIINAALLSFGVSGKYFHAPFLHTQPGFKLVGAWERSKQQIQSLYPGTISYPSLPALLQDKAVELVIVNTPNDTHFEFAQMALLAGKHAVVEKAFTTTVEEAQTLAALANQQNKMLTVYHNRRWDSDFLTVQSVLAKGLLGSVVDATIRFDRYRVELSAKAHKEIPSKGSGLWKDLGPHLIDQALQLFGKPQSVQAVIKAFRPTSLVNDWFVVQLLYPDKVVALQSSCLVKECLPAYVINGAQGSFHKTRSDVQEQALMQGILPNAVNWGQEATDAWGWVNRSENGQEEKYPYPSERGNYGTFYEGVYNAIRYQQPPPVQVMDAINVMEVLVAAEVSDATGSRVLV